MDDVPFIGFPGGFRARLEQSGTYPYYGDTYLSCLIPTYVVYVAYVPGDKKDVDPASKGVRNKKKCCWR